MPQYRIGGSYGYAGSDWAYEVEAEDLAEAEEMAHDRAMESVEYWAEPVDDGPEKDAAPAEDAE